MSSVDIEFTYGFTNGQTTEYITVIERNKTDAYSAARQEAINRNLASDVGDFEKEFTIDELSYRYADPPWDSDSQLEKHLRNITGVTSIQYISPTTGAYGPPTYHLHVASDQSPSTVKSEVKNYFSGLNAQVRNGTVEVELSPTVD